MLIAEVCMPHAALRKHQPLQHRIAAKNPIVYQVCVYLIVTRVDTAAAVTIHSETDQNLASTVVADVIGSAKLARLVWSHLTV